MRGQLTGLWRAANGQPLPWQNLRRFSWSVWEPGIPMGVRQQGPGAASLPCRGLFMQLHTYRSSPSQPASRKGVQRGDLHCFCPEQLQDPQLLGTLLGASEGKNSYSHDVKQVC